MKKRHIIISAAGLLSLSAAIFTAFAIHQSNKPLPAGTVDKASIKPIVSVLYSEEDYDEAVECVKEFFPQFENCELRTLRYAGDRTASQEAGCCSRPDIIAEHEKAAENMEYIVLSSDFYVNPEPLFHSCNDAWKHDSVYSGWTWTLSRTKGSSEWTICNYGYA